ncbi:tRNA-splicing ligase RtcB [Candidatus Norongarragalina meridionalis]|nr:tRNA-splicing ligase RtcB [Candidatus Norongarragalina meridionalis]
MGLLPLKVSNSASFLQFIRIFGLRYADGCIYQQTRNRSFTFHICFGDKKDALRLIDDAREAWNIKLHCCFSSRAYYVYFPASIARLLICAGSPFGRKTRQSFSLPRWIFLLPDNLQFEFIGGLFAGDGSVPRLKRIGTASESLKLSLSAERNVAEHFSKDFMLGVHILLKHLGVRSTSPKVKWTSPRISKNGVTTYPVEIRILTEKRNMEFFLRNVPYRYCSRAAVGAEKVLSGLNWIKQKSEVRDYFSSGFPVPAPKLSLLFDAAFQRNLVLDAAKTFASSGNKSSDGRIGALAEYLRRNCRNLDGAVLSSVRDSYLPSWAAGKKFIPTDCAFEMARLAGEPPSVIQNNIKLLKHILSNNRRAVEYAGEPSCFV